MRRFLQAAVVWTALFFGAAVHATPIVYTLTGTASGELAGGGFVQVAFSLSGTGESSALETPDMGVAVVPLQSLIVELDGFGQFEAVNKTYFFVNRNVALAGFLDLFAGDIIDLAAAFSGYDGLTTLGPMAVTDDYLGQFDTSAGTLLFTDASALVLQVAGQDAGQVPEPGSMLLLTIGLAAFAGGRRLVWRRVSWPRWGHLVTMKAK